MSGIMTTNTDHVIRSQLWSSEIKDVLYSEMMGVKYVKWLDQFPDGDTFNIPSIGQAEINDYVEGNQIQYTGMDTGNFTFSIDQYKQSGTFMTNKMKQDSMYANEFAAAFVPKQARAIAEAMEAKWLAIGPEAQTAGNLNLINGGRHRFVGSGASAKIAVQDFAFAKYALLKANVPQTNLIAIVDPSVGLELEKLTNITNVSNNAMWEGIITTGMSTGMKFVRNIYGFDVYVSNFLKLSSAAETINAVAAPAGSAANLFFSATTDVLPFVGAIRQAPKVDSEYNKDLQRDEYVTTCRYGFKLFRPENLVTVLTDPAQAYV